MKRHRVELTPADIARGVPRKPTRCGVFLACERAAGAIVQAVRGDGSIVVRSWRDRYGLDAVMDERDRRFVRDNVEALDHGFSDLATPGVFYFEEPA